MNYDDLKNRTFLVDSKPLPNKTFKIIMTPDAAAKEKAKRIILEAIRQTEATMEMEAEAEVDQTVSQIILMRLDLALKANDNDFKP